MEYGEKYPLRGRPSRADPPLKGGTIVGAGPLGHFHKALVGVLEQQEGQAQLESDRMATVSNRLQPYGDDRDAMVVSFLSKQGCATVGDIAKLLGLSKDRTRAVLRDMAQRGLIVKVGAGRATRYELSE